MNLKNSGRYNVSREEGFEPDSNDQVLKNLLGIKSLEIMAKVEAEELKRAELEAFRIYDKCHRFTVKDICNLHKIWLGNIYPFAGKYRSVNMSKEGFPFAGANYIPGCMRKFEGEYLAKYTPCNLTDTNTLAEALAVVHVEFIVIHPFREGNGRIGRLLTILMALQAGKPPLDFRLIDQVENPTGFKRYIDAIQAGVAKDYVPLQVIFENIIEGSEK